MENMRELFTKYLDDACTVAEIELLIQYFGNELNEKELKCLITARLNDAESHSFELGLLTSHEDLLLDQRIQKIYTELKPKLTETVKIHQTWQFAPILRYAAALFVLGSVALYFYLNQNKPAVQNNLTVRDVPTDVAPGGNKAKLILADGSVISLAESKNGNLAEQPGVMVSKTEAGQLVYSSQSKAENEIAYNTVETPAGGQYQLILSDGTKVYLNSLSSLKFPSNFTGSDRRVELHGEGFFEVAKNPQAPFIVSSKHQEVTVLGTHFNINNYEDEGKVTTTLVSGSVRVANRHGSAAVLVPAQQSTINYTDKKLRTTEVDTESAIAWKNGDFVFRDQPVNVVMRQIARWYDVSVEYDKDAPLTLKLGGTVSRSNSLMAVLKAMEATEKIKFVVNNKIITVKNKSTKF